MVFAKRDGRIKSLGLFFALVLLLTIMPLSSALAVSFTTTQITNNPYTDWEPQIDGDTVVWRGSDGDDFEVFLYDIPTQTTTQLTDNIYLDDYFAKVEGNWVVWQGWDGSDWEISLYDISNKTTI